MNTERTQVGWRFWLWWVLASTVGAAVGQNVGDIVFFFFHDPSPYYRGFSFVPETAFGAMLGISVGASLGITQWLVLRRQVSWASDWVLASAVGGAIGGTVGGAVGALVGETLHGAVLGAFLGLSLGIAQWFVMQWQVSGSGWWVLVTTAGIAFVVAVSFGEAVELVWWLLLLPVALAAPDFYFGPVVGENWIVALVVYGAITGTLLVWLLRQPVTEEPSPPQASE
jgi:hypothetical protein